MKKLLTFLIFFLFSFTCIYQAYSYKLNGWGSNSQFQLGDNSQIIPHTIGSIFTKVACGYYHTIGIKDDGTLWAWGYNGYGQLGDGTTTQRLTPVQIGIESDWHLSLVEYIIR